MLEVNNLSKSVDDRILFSNVSFKIPRASIVGMAPGSSTTYSVFAPSY